MSFAINRMSTFLCRPSGKGKTYQDMLFERYKKIGWINLWRRYCFENGKWVKGLNF